MTRLLSLVVHLQSVRLLSYLYVLEIKLEIARPSVNNSVTISYFYRLFVLTKKFGSLFTFTETKMLENKKRETISNSLSVNFYRYTVTKASLWILFFPPAVSFLKLRADHLQGELLVADV